MDAEVQKYRKDEAKRAAEKRWQAKVRKKKSDNVALTEKELEKKPRLSQANMAVGLAKIMQGRSSKIKPQEEKSQPGKSLITITLCNLTSHVRLYRETLCGGVSNWLFKTLTQRQDRVAVHDDWYLEACPSITTNHNWK